MLFFILFYNYCKIDIEEYNRDGLLLMQPHIEKLGKQLENIIRQLLLKEISFRKLGKTLVN